MVNKLYEFLKWMFPIRYWFHRRASGDHAMPRAEWEQFIRDCDYTVWGNIKLEVKWCREDPVKWVRSWIGIRI